MANWTDADRERLTIAAQSADDAVRNWAHILAEYAHKRPTGRRTLDERAVFVADMLSHLGYEAGDAWDETTERLSGVRPRPTYRPRIDDDR